MKREADKYWSRLCLSLIVPVIMIAGCKKGGGENHAASKEVVAEDTVDSAVAAEDTIPDAELISAGIEPIRVGMRVVDIAPKVENLYDSIVNQGGYESNSYYFYLYGKQRFTAYEFSEGKVSVVSADDGSIVVKGADGETLRIGDPMAKVMSLKGVKTEWQPADDEGMWCWNWKGIWFLPDQEVLTEQQTEALYNPDKAPSAKEFGTGVKIGYMGTGLPW